MKKVRVSFILVLVISALLALLLIQAFQTKQLYDRKSTEFNSRFTTTLDRIAFQHEKAVDIRKYMQFANNDFSGQYKDILKEEFQHLLSAQETISIQDTTIFENGKMENYLIIKGHTYDSITGITAEQRVKARDVRQLRDLFKRTNPQTISKDSVQLAIELDQRVLQQIFKKARFVNEMILETFRNNVYETPEQRVDIAFLDSVLKHEMIEDRPTKYAYMIVNETSEPVNFKNAPKDYSVHVDTTKAHSTMLYPSNPLDENLTLYIQFPKQKSFLIMEMWGPVFVNLLLVSLIIVSLIIMFKTILTQKKLSEMKNDFISNMTHEFKTPISTISLACEAMNDTDMIGENTSNVSPYVKMINEENKRLAKLVERILQSASLEKKEIQLNKEDVLLNELLENLVQKAQFRIESSGGEIKLKMPSEFIHISCDRMHTTNAISNLIDNAIKYSETTPEISIELSRKGKEVELRISDKGIGIKKEHINKIFNKLYRIPTGNIHNVKGFGLGLSYVKAIVEIQGWGIYVNSRPEQGSVFTLIMK